MRKITEIQVNQDFGQENLFRLKPRREYREEKLQGALVEYFAAVVPAGEALLFAVPNGEYRDKKTAARLAGPEKDERLPDDALMVPAGQGVLHGAPDLILLTGGGKVTLIEVKAPEAGSRAAGNFKAAGILSRFQKAFRRFAELLGHYYVVIESVDEFDALLRRKGVNVRAVLIGRAFGLTS